MDVLKVLFIKSLFFRMNNKTPLVYIFSISSVDFLKSVISCFFAVNEIIVFVNNVHFFL